MSTASASSTSASSAPSTIPNPFLTNRAQLIQAFYPVEPEAYIINLYVLSALYAVALLLIVVGFAGRVMRRTFSLCRKEATAYGVYLVLDAPILSGLLQALFILIAEVYIWEHILVLTRHASQLQAVILQGMVWMPLYLAGVVIIRGVALNFILMRYRRADPGSVPRWTKPSFVGMFSYLFPSLFAVPVTVVFIVASQLANASFVKFSDLTDQLLVAGAQYNGTLDEGLSARLVAAEVDLAEDTLVWKRLVKVGFGIYFVAAFALLCIFVPFTLMHLKLLRAQIRLLAPGDGARRHSSVGSLSQLPLVHARMASDSTFESFDTKEWDWPGAGARPESEARVSHEPDRARAASASPPRRGAPQGSEPTHGEERRALQRAFWNIARQLLALTALVTAFGIFGATTAVANAMGLDGVNARRREVLSSLYIYAAFGLVAQTFTVIRSFDRPTPLTKSTLSSNLEAAVGFGFRGRQPRASDGGGGGGGAGVGDTATDGSKAVFGGGGERLAFAFPPTDRRF